MATRLDKHRINKGFGVVMQFFFAGYRMTTWLRFNKCNCSQVAMVVDNYFLKVLFL